MYVGKTLRRRGLFVLAISSILIVAASAQTNNYKLAGAGSSEVNGIYFHTGATYGELSRPKYQKAGTGTTVYVYNAQYSVDLSYYWNIDNDLDDENDAYYYWNGAFDGTPTTFPVTGASPNNWSNTGAGFGIGTTPISTQLAIVTPSFTNGSSFTAVKVTSGATNYVVGRFQLQGNTEGAVLQAVTISLAGTRSGITAVKLWSSSDATFNSGSDVQLSSKTDATSITFNGFNTVVDHSTGTYYFITVDLSVGSTGNVTPTIPSQASFTFAGANSPSSFTSAALSSAAVYLQNTTPTSSNNTVSTTEDNDKTFASSDFPYTDADGDVLTNLQITTLESAGTLYLDANSNGINDSEDITLNQIISAANISKLKLKPAANANGSPYATFGFKVGDASVYSATTYTMTINVTAVNDAPTSANNIVTTNEDVTKTFASGDFSFTDIDAGDALNKIQITTLENAGTLYFDTNSNGSNDAEDVTLNQEITTANISKLKFLPAANANGNGYATFQFKVSDGTVYSTSSYTMTINVGVVNDPPTAANNTVSATEDNDKTFASADFNYSDTEGSTLSLVQIATTPSAGTLYNDANLNSTVDGGEALSASSTVTKAAIDSGKLKFKPAANGNGSPYTTFTFKVNDGTDYSTSSYTMTINVTPVVDVTFTDGSVYAPPSASPSTNNNSVGRFLLTGDISGASLSALTVSFVSSPSGVTAVKLWSSSDNAYDSGTDTQVSSTTVSGTTASFSSFSSSISSSGTYYFVSVDLNSSASGTIEPSIVNNSHITISSGILAGTITNAALSNGEAPLPVELTAFSASSKRLNVELQWKTATEVNNYGFEIERKAVSSQLSANSQQLKAYNWVNVGFIEGGGTSNAPKEYIFTDKSSAAGKYLYRLKQIDRDGKFGYSKEVEIETGSTAKVFELSQNFPNPFNPTTAIEFSVPEDGMTTLKVFDILGREVRTLINEELKAGVIQQVEFDASHLSSGVYFARLQFKNNIQMKRMMLVK